MSKELIQKLEEYKASRCECGERACPHFAPIDDAIEIVRKHTGWQPISTAPKDGTRILVFQNGGRGIAWWQGTGGEPSHLWCHHDGDFRAYCNPTHWMPLPPPPEQGESD
jgi:hypothetical protein